MEYITVPAERVPLLKKADVVVVGAGPAGFGAAVRAAQKGADTLVIERFGSPGGMIASGLMCVCVGEALGGLHTELLARLGDAGYMDNPLERFPELSSNPLFHYYGPNIAPKRKTAAKITVFDPVMAAVVMSRMMEERGVRFLLRTLFVDSVVENGTVSAVIVENASGRQAVGGKIFIDATGRGDVAARSGVPFTGAGNEKGLPIPPGLMWSMAGVDYEALFAYQKQDPGLDALMEKARANGDLPHYRPKRMDLYGGAYTGHPRLEMCPTLFPGDMLLWASAVYEWGLNCAESAEDLTRAETELRKHIMAEADFLKKYVPGFEGARVSGIAPFMGIREGRHPQGEYVMPYEDIRNQCRFEDAALRRKSFDWADMGQADRLLTFDIPFRCFLAKGADNLLLAGDNISMEHKALLHMRGFGMAVRTGEVAGMAAGQCTGEGIRPKDLEWKEAL